MPSLLARIRALPERVQDLGLAIALTVVDLATLLAYRRLLHPFWAAALLVVVETAPLVWRRSHAVPVFLVSGAARVAYDLVGFGFAPLPLGPALALFSVVDRCDTKVRRVIAVLLVAGITASQLSPGHTQPYDASVAGLIFLTTWIAGSLARTHRGYLQALEAAAADAEARRAADALQAAAEERIRIARELHDVVAHHVSLIAVQSEAAGSLLPARPEDAARSVEVIGRTARQTLTELRRLLGVMRAPGAPIETAPVASLGQLGVVLDEVRRAGMAVDLEVTGAVCDLAPSVDLAAFRIVQEALTNSLRHAGSAAAVKLCYEPGSLTVSVGDAGSPYGTAPFGPGAVSGSGAVSGAGSGSGAGAGAGGQPTGFGLAGIAERVASCGGDLSMGATPTGGFLLTARLPTS